MKIKVQTYYTKFAENYFSDNANNFGCNNNGIELPAEIKNVPDLQRLYKTVLQQGRNHDKLYYFNANHLGSGSLITDDAGQTYQTIIYAPHGEILTNQFAGNYDERAKFNGGELDAETGNYNIGVRQNDPKLGIWTSTEPKWQDYPQWSGYISMGNNPISYVDKDGREIWLAFYGVNGKREEVIKYTPCMKYNGSNQFIASTIERLNKINSVKNGGILLDKLSSSTNKYVYSNLILPNNENAGAATTSKKNGEIYFLMGKNPSLMKDAHELFHGWQIDNNFGGETDQNEVEAYLFGNSVAWNYAMSNPMDVESQNILKSFSFDFGNNRNKFSLLKLEQQFNKAFNSLLDSKASDFQINGNYQTAISTFRCGSIFNANGLYDDNLSIPLHKPLIFEFIPLIEDN